MAVPFVSTKPKLLPVCVCACARVLTSHHTPPLAAESRQTTAGLAFHMSLISGWVRGKRDGTIAISFN